MTKKTIEVGDHIKIQMSENNQKVGQYQGREADVKGEIDNKPRILELLVNGLDDIIYVEEDEVSLIQ
jgi:hypothetical protein